jgi:peptidoglycan/xylan/chitin deacetylase (PgdA/CDA1 family)/SAM-dependent methyltransferase
MTRASIAAVVRCGDLIDGVYGSVESLQRQMGRGAWNLKAAIVADPTTPVLADAWLNELARTRGLSFLRVDIVAPGRCWNAGLEAAGSADFGICIEAGESLAASALEQLLQRAASEVAVVASGIEWLGPGTRRGFSEPTVAAPADLLANTGAAHVSSLFRWSAWKGSSGFDERLPALEYTDLWLRMLEEGGALAALSAPLLRRRVHARALYRRTWLTGEYARAAQMLIERHAGTAAAAPAVVLGALERTVNREHLRHRASVAREQKVQREIDDLRSRERALLSEVPADWRPGVDLGAFARTSPLSHDWGYARGTPADRPVIERYLAAHAVDICGTVLEIQEDDYTRRFGGARVERSDVLDVNADNPRATIIGDLRAASHLAAGTYDCIILTQTLHVIDDMEAVVRECERLLKPGGVLLATLPSASRVCLEYGPEGDFWRTTEAGARRLFAQVFPAALVVTSAFGNPLLNAAFAYGLAGEELPASAYEDNDPYFPMLIGVRAQKPRDTARVSATRQRPAAQGVILMYHRVGDGKSDPHQLSVSVPAFRAQLEWLTRSCSVVSLEQLASNGFDGQHPVALTFDDGYLDNLVNAMPPLRESGLPATFFLTTGDGPHPYHYWWDRLAAAFVGDHEVPSTLAIALPSGRQLLHTSTPQQRLAAHWAIYREIVRLSVADREEVLTHVIGWAGGAPPSVDNRRMTWDEVRQLGVQPLCSIGAHSHDHLFLPAQSDDVLERELVSSRETLERITGLPVRAFAYPFGAVDDRAVAAARRAGYVVAVTCVEEAVATLHDRLALPRVAVTDQPLDRFIQSVERAFEARC